MSHVWKKCSSCKNDILLGQRYYVCSVSTCQGKVTNYAFCSVDCWDAHLPTERHRPDSAGAIERTAPKEAGAPDPIKRIPTSAPATASAAGKSSVEDEVLVVVTKVRRYIADRSGMNTSAEVYDTLTEKLKELCDRAIEVAKSSGRKTVMSRDF